MKEKITVVMLILCIIMASVEYYALAITKDELNNQNKDLDNQISEKKDEIDEKNSELSAAMKEVQDLVGQIGTYEQAISDLNTQINDVSSRIEETENNINQKEKELQEKQELLNKRLVAIYESGNTSYLEMLLTSADLSDFISKYYLISEIAEYDSNLITSIRNFKSELESAKANLENDKQTLENSKSEQVKKRDELASLKKEKEKKAANLNAEEKALEKELEDFEADKRKVQAELEAVIRKEAEEAERKRKEAEAAAKKNNNSNSSSSGNTGTVSTAPNEHGYIFPVAGLSKANIRNTTYPSYANHTGVDVNIGVVGKNVVAVKAGTVVISEAKKINGKYYSYGEFIVINHHDGTMTAYAHMLEGSRTVQPGDKVSQGQKIGIVGSTGRSTGPHLHFEVRVNARPVNPIPYL
ncbi:MAG: peptidoglycan DD-metalloendopeptidase family protein [Clostridia bacterium]|nr:peptidoglycan DD-metalloendopeptidase family protein [Clostridia bacterium]